ncbi:hypothetical protein AX15_005118 [Amanita polypyramis BW_CC]|nr:hypothetical protein AX15_005118 [Amanita polypyramis BW_CC]
MASSSSSSFTNNNAKPSRYPSLKSFKFITKEKGLKPPPPPPKDPNYIPNRVLSPETLSIPPNSPISPYHTQYHHKSSPGPSQSSLSLVSSATSARSQSADTSRQSRLKAKASSLFTLVKRPNRTARSPDPERPPSPQEDSGISTPWNFQHNIHVDEGFIGLPPSWSTQLTSAGFSPEEIAAIQARRVNVYGGRPETLNLRINTTPPVISPAPGRSLPRTSSLTRQLSDVSLRSSSQGHSRSPPPASTITQVPLTSSPSSTSLRSVTTTATNSSRNPLSQNSHAPAPTNGSVSCTSLSQSELVDGQTTNHVYSDSTRVTSNEYKRPSTPPRKPFYVVNASHLMSSPPPAYSQSALYTPDKKTRTDNSRTPPENDMTQVTPSYRQQPSTDSNTTFTPPGRRVSIIRNKRNSILPPRLSLHKDAGSLDLSSWSAELLSGISSSSLSSNASDASAMGLSKTPLTNITSPRSGSSSSKSFGGASRSPLSQGSLFANPPDRRQGYKHPPSRPAPPIILQSEALEDEGAHSHPPPTGWAEPAPVTRVSPPSPTVIEPNSRAPSTTLSEFGSRLDKSSKSPSTYSAALEDSHSPTLPASPGTGSRPSPPARTPPAEPRRNNSLPQSYGDPDESFLHVDEAPDDHANRHSSRSSSSTLTVTGYTETALVRNASVVRRTSAYVIDKTSLGPAQQQGGLTPGVGPLPPPIGVQSIKHPSSPLSSHFGSEEDSTSGSVSSSSPSQHPTPTDTDSPLNYYMGTTYTPPPSRPAFATKAPVHMLVSKFGTFGGVQEEDEQEEQYDPGVEGILRPKIVIDRSSPPASSAPTPGGLTPQTPALRYRGWLSEVVKPLEEFIDEAIDPREYYIDLQEIAVGESGSVFAAQIARNEDLSKLRLDPNLVAQDKATLQSGDPVAIAIKSVAIVPSGSPKLIDLEKEVKLMKGLFHQNVLTMDALYVDLMEDSLWIRMELMERSLADVVSLVDSGLMLHDRMIARFASDVLQALQFLQQHDIAHRDVRSDNLLLNLHGVLKLADFSGAVQVSPSSPMRSDAVGVAYWQAPEIGTPPYNVLKVDVWSLGATVWELAEAEPPFASSQQLSDRWPPLSQPKLFSPAFHDFLRQCSEPAASRPDAAKLCSHPLMKNACGRSVIIQLLAQCMTIEKQQYRDEEES